MTHLTVGGDFKATEEEGSAPNKKNVIPTPRVDVANLMNIGYYLLAPLLGGLGLGLLIDSKLQLRPYFTIAGIMLGAIASFYNLYRVVRESQGSK